MITTEAVHDELVKRIGRDLIVPIPFEVEVKFVDHKDSIDYSIRVVFAPYWLEWETTATDPQAATQAQWPTDNTSYFRLEKVELPDLCSDGNINKVAANAVPQVIVAGMLRHVIKALRGIREAVDHEID